jgi:hypothetical protein
MAQFAEGDQEVLIMDVNGDVYTWRIAPDLWSRFACRVAGRSLTEAEWSQFLGERAYDPTCPD